MRRQHESVELSGSPTYRRTRTVSYVSAADGPLGGSGLGSQVLYHPALVPVGGPDTRSVLYMVHTDRPTLAHTAALSFLGILCLV